MVSNFYYTSMNFHPRDKNKINHIGLIPDGTGRWAQKQGMELLDAYYFSSRRIYDFICLAIKKSVKIISIYGSSIQNYRREKERIDAFTQAQKLFLKDILLPEANKNHWKIKIVGNLNLLPIDFQIFLENLQVKTSKYSQCVINFLIAYSPIDEIENAITISKNNENVINNLWVKEPLDLVIRTGNANLLSNFLPLQAGYARLYFIDKLFPEVDNIQYLKIIEEFSRLDRKFGD